MAPQIDRRTGLQAGAAIKLPVKAATTGNITLSGEQTIDGVACVTDDRVLVKDQTDATENGVWIVDTGTWSRAPDFDGSNDVVKGTLVLVVSGTVNGPSFWQVTTDDPIVPGTSEIEFAVRANQIAGVSAFVNTLLDDTTATVFLATLGLTISAFAKTLLDDADAAAFVATLGNVPTLTGTETFENKTLGTGCIVPLARIARTNAANRNTLVVTVTSSATQIALAALGNVVSGDLILVTARVDFLKGGTNGRSRVEVNKASGTATITAQFSNTALQGDDIDQTTATTRSLNVAGMILVTGDGDLTLRLSGISDGSDSTVDSQQGQLRVCVLREL